MSAVPPADAIPDVELPRTDASRRWTGAWKVAAIVGYVGLAASIYGAFREPGRFGASYLTAFFVCLSLPIGALFFVLIQRLTKAHWSVPIRRSSEFLTAGLPIFLVLVVPLLASTQHVYPWDGAPRETEVVQAGAFANAKDEGNQEPYALRIANQGALPRLQHAAEAEEAHILHGRAGFLNRPFFALRSFGYLAILSFVALRLFRHSTRQDRTGAIEESQRAERFAPAGMVLFAITLSLSAFDWLMSLEAKWCSNVFAIYVFAGCVVFHSAMIILFAMLLRRGEVTRSAITVEHFHDLGKLLFGFVAFWAYIAYAQFFLSWYANLPEEVAFFHRRWTDQHGSWRALSASLFLVHFCLPFWLLLSRNAKRSLRVLGFGAAVVAVMHVLEIYWIVMPNFGAFAPHWLDVSCLVAVGGLYAMAVLRAMESHAPIPVRDPRLSRAFQYDNG